MAGKFVQSSSVRMTVLGLVVIWITTRVCFGLKRDPRTQFYGHTVIIPKVYSASREKRDIGSLKIKYEEKLTVTFKALARHFDLDLKLNDLLLSQNYFEKYQENGIEIVRPKGSTGHCHYQGKVRGIKNSFVAISTCDGLSGMIIDEEEIYYLHPDLSTDQHYLFRAKDMKPQNMTCGVSDSTDVLKTGIFQANKRSKRSPVRQKLNESREKPRYVELIIINDYRQFMEFNGDASKVFYRSIGIANILNGLYAPLNIHIVLNGAIIWSDYDQITVTPNSKDTLAEFLRYRQYVLSLMHPNDNAQLITAVEFDDHIVGKSMKGSICTNEYSGGINMDHNYVLGPVAATVAHELGHNLGMEDDTKECDCPDDHCIMRKSSGRIIPRRWSSCSVQALNEAFSKGRDYCLRNYPTTFVGPVCGNGFLEEGEECDCGLPELCISKCCNATSCQLLPGANCATGECCDMNKCQVKAEATVCRVNATECDLPEYCNGTSELCPADVFYQDGKECGEGKAYCFNGQCKSHSDQCRLLYGITGKMGDPKCYEQNENGGATGNCGYNPMYQGFIRCERNSIMCGLLHCASENDQLQFGFRPSAHVLRSRIYKNGEARFCYSAMIDLGYYNRDPGLVPDGAKCGQRKVCSNQRCIPVESFASANCSFDCYGNGVCNNNGNCHCDFGYGPPYCQSYGPGGSIDSGPASVVRKYGYFVLEVFLVALTSKALLALAIYYGWKCLKKNSCKNFLSNAISKNTPLKVLFRRRDIDSAELYGFGVASVDSTVPYLPISPLPQSTNNTDESSDNKVVFSLFVSQTAEDIVDKESDAVATTSRHDIKRPELDSCTAYGFKTVHSPAIFEIDLTSRRQCTSIQNRPLPPVPPDALKSKGLVIPDNSPSTSSPSVLLPQKTDESENLPPKPSRKTLLKNKPVTLPKLEC